MQPAARTLDALAHISTGINVALGKGLVDHEAWRSGLVDAGCALDDLINELLADAA